MKRPRWIRIAIAIVLAAVVLGWGKWQRGALPGGVELKQNAAGYRALVVKKAGVLITVVTPDVQWAKGHGAFVYGYKKAFPNADGVLSAEGYFVFDTGTRRAQEGLSKEDAERVLGIGL